MEYLSAIIPATRVSVQLKSQLMQELLESHHTSLSALIREKLATTEITSYHKHRVEVLQELGAFRNELNRIGNNVNQVAKVVNRFKNGKLLQNEIAILNQLQQELATISAFLDDISPVSYTHLTLPTILLV